MRWLKTLGATICHSPDRLDHSFLRAKPEPMDPHLNGHLPGPDSTLDCGSLTI